MKEINILIKMIILLLLEKKHTDEITSRDLGKQLLNAVSNKKQTDASNTKDILNGLKGILSEIIDSENVDVVSFVENAELVLSDKPNLSTLIRKFIDSAFDDKIRAIKRNEIHNYIVREELNTFLNIQNMVLKNPTSNVGSVLKALKEKIGTLDVNEGVSKNSTMGEINFDDDMQVEKIIDEIDEMYNNSNVYNTGWKSLNTMLAGGIRSGELCSIAALPHNYKSGLTKSLVVQMIRLNKPMLRDKTKKPLMIFFSAEEELRTVLMFTYGYFKYLKEGKTISANDSIDKTDMKKYIDEYLREKALFNLKIIRLNPSDTTYLDILEHIKRYEKEGYEVHGIFIDYLSQISRHGCDTSGPMGSDYKDLFKRIRNELAMKKIFCITPHQISTEAKRLIKNGVPNIEFVKHLPGKGYYAHSSQLDQEFDIEIFVHKAFINRKPVLTLQRGKHRFPGKNENEEDLFIIMDFPKDAPIIEDYTNEDGDFITLTRDKDTVEDEFNF